MRATAKRSRQVFVHDVLLICIMAVLAACGLIYEYLLSHYAGRVIGAIETAIYTMIGLMIVSMGLGALAAKLIKDPFSGFAWLEASIAICGVSCILIIATLVSFSAVLPRVIAETFSLPPDLVPDGGLISLARELAMLTPYLFGILIGFLIGMEIPLIARVREQIYGQHLEHNVGTIYGADYIGAGIGAALWVTIMLGLEITEAAVLTAIANLVAGIIFLLYYWSNIVWRLPLLGLHGAIFLLALAVYQFGSDWTIRMTALLYEDPVVYNNASRYQSLTITERYLGSGNDPLYGFYINGRLQFSSNDEHIYHSMLVYPALSVADPQPKVLIVGGGDGLALRDVLQFEPESVTLIDLDQELVEFFSPASNMQHYRSALVQLNEQAFADSRVEVVIGDAFLEVDKLRDKAKNFDAIIVDLPDPSHPDLDRLYSSYFYQRLYDLLSANGVMAVQSTSPYHAKKAFISIGKTISAAGFPHVEQYRQNIPSFGEWGWTVASKQKTSTRQRLLAMKSLSTEHHWLTRDLAIASFEFPKDFFQDDDVKINTLGTNQIYQYHSEAWKSELGLYLD